MIPDPRRAVVCVSGGLDSVTLAYALEAQGFALTFLSVNYGQRHLRELEFAEQHARLLRARSHLIDLRTLGRLLTGSALTDPRVEVPLGHYEAPSMRQTIVANRNAILLNCALAIAISEGAAIVATAVHAGDHAIYPDCRPAFIDSLNASAELATDGQAPPVVAPFVHMTKAQIVTYGRRLDVEFDRTWSCYSGDRQHCGACGTCVERRLAFAEAGVADPTVYHSAAPSLADLRLTAVG